MKHKHLHPGFELGSINSFLMTISVALYMNHLLSIKVEFDSKGISLI